MVSRSSCLLFVFSASLFMTFLPFYLIQLLRVSRYVKQAIDHERRSHIPDASRFLCALRRRWQLTKKLFFYPWSKHHASRVPDLITPFLLANCLPTKRVPPAGPPSPLAPLFTPSNHRRPNQHRPNYYFPNPSLRLPRPTRLRTDRNARRLRLTVHLLRRRLHSFPARRRRRAGLLEPGQDERSRPFHVCGGDCCAGG